VKIQENIREFLSIHSTIIRFRNEEDYWRSRLTLQRRIKSCCLAWINCGNARSMWKNLLWSYCDAINSRKKWLNNQCLSIFISRISFIACIRAHTHLIITYHTSFTCNIPIKSFIIYHEFVSFTTTSNLIGPWQICNIALMNEAKQGLPKQPERIRHRIDECGHFSIRYR